MKKNKFLLFTLIISLFIFCGNVSADTIELDSSNLENVISTYINEDFISCRSEIINLLDSQYKQYEIFFQNNRVELFLISGHIGKNPHYSYNKSIFFNEYMSPGAKKYICNNGDLTLLQTTSTASTFNFKIYDSSLLFSPSFLDSNINIIFDSSLSSGSVLHFSYKTRDYNITSSDSFPSLYQLYLDSNSPINQPLENATSKITDFYSIVFEKINLFNNTIVSDYIFYFIIVIWLIFLLCYLIKKGGLSK